MESLHRHSPVTELLDNPNPFVLKSGFRSSGGLMALSQEPVRECMFHGQDPAGEEDFPGIRLRAFASSGCGARNFHTGLASLQPGARLPPHFHGASEAITILEGEALIQMGAREYRLRPFDCIHVPAHAAHSVANESPDRILLAHSSFADPSPTRTLVEAGDSGKGTEPAAPELVRRFETIETYALADGTVFRDLFAKRFGAVGICGGHGRFLPGSSLPCHVHRYDESITIVGGEALCQVEGREYTLGRYDTAFVPEGHAHRFLNVSNEPMMMVWVYAGDEPDRILVDPSRCSGSTADAPTGR